MSGPVDPAIWPRRAMQELADWLGIPLSTAQHTQLERFGQWLLDEAAPAGGIGPREAERLFDRHVGDSLTYVTAVPTDAERLVDVGSGVGLPGLPIEFSPHAGARPKHVGNFGGVITESYFQNATQQDVA